MSVKINIVDSNLQITKRNTDGTISENLEWETPEPKSVEIRPFVKKGPKMPVLAKKPKELK